MEFGRTDAIQFIACRLIAEWSASYRCMCDRALSPWLSFAICKTFTAEKSVISTICICWPGVHCCRSFISCCWLSTNKQIQHLLLSVSPSSARAYALKQRPSRDGLHIGLSKNVVQCKQCRCRQYTCDSQPKSEDVVYQSWCILDGRSWWYRYGWFSQVDSPSCMYMRYLYIQSILSGD